MEQTGVSTVGSEAGQNTEKTSEGLFGIQWQGHFPFNLSDQEKVETSTWQDTQLFIQENFNSIYPSEEQLPRFFREEWSRQRLKYYETAGDCFAFKDGAKSVGVFVGTPLDWSSYYIRNISILPGYQNGKRYQRLLTHLLSVLQEYGIARVETDVSPSNLAHIHLLNKFQFNVSGINMTDRWGVVLKFTKFMNRKAEAVFLQQYCDGVWPQLKNDH